MMTHFLSTALALSVVCGTSALDFNVTRVVVGGSLAINSVNPIIEPYRGFGPRGVKVISAAGTNPIGDGTSIVNQFIAAGISAEWIPIHSTNCNTNAFNPEIVDMIEDADAIYYSGGQSGRLQSCLYGRFSTNGIEVRDGEMTPVLAALQAKSIVGGSSAGAMNQPSSEILVTASSVESYSAVSQGSVFQRNAGNAMVLDAELIDTHFSERGRQGRLMIIAMQADQRFAFGVDEDSAYFWRPDGTHEVVGESVRLGIKAGVVVYQDVTGDSLSQSGLMHFLTTGDTINVNTGEIVFNADKSPCPPTVTPEVENNIFDRTGFPYRLVSLQMSTAPSGSTLRNFHGTNPRVEVEFTKTGATKSMCGPSGQSFSNLEVSQFAQARFGRAKVDVQEPELPIDFIWEIDH